MTTQFTRNVELFTIKNRGNEVVYSEFSKRLQNLEFKGVFVLNNYGNNVQFQVYRSGKKSDLPVSFEELEKLAHEKLDESSFYYIAGGAGKEHSMKENRYAFEKWKIVPRMLRNVSVRDISDNLFGRTYQSPILFAPIGVQTIAHPNGELEAAKAAAALKIPYIASTVASFSLERIATGLALGGKDGIIQVLKNIIADFDLTMALSGQSSISELNPSLLLKEVNDKQLQEI